MLKILKTKLFFVFALILVTVMMPEAVTTVYATESEPVKSIDDLINAIPEITDSIGTHYYFYNQLDTTEKAVYWEMTRATLEDPVFIIKGEKNQNINFPKIWCALRSDQPYYHEMWDNCSASLQNDDEIVVEMHSCTAASYYLIKEADARLKKITETVGNSGDSYTKIRKLCDIIANEMKYDGDFALSSNRHTDINDTAIGPLVYNQAVCGGFAQFFKMACDSLNIPCIEVGNVSHAWNYVKMEDGNWYSLDASQIGTFSEEFLGDGEVLREFVLLGSTSEQYKANENFAISDIYLYELGEMDITYPVLSGTQYEYKGSYEWEYESTNCEFDKPDGKFIYSVNDDMHTCTITDYQGKMEGDLIVPETLDGYTVTTIGDGAFYKCSGFDGDLIVPNTVTVIEKGAFFQCDGLKGSLTLSDNLEIIEDSAFAGCSGLSQELVLPGALKRLGRGAFYKCRALSGDILLPAQLEYIGEEAFMHCSSLNGSLYLPPLIDTIPNEFITDTHISEFSISEDNNSFSVFDGILYSKDKKTLYLCPQCKEGEIEILSGTEVIANSAFNGCNQLAGNLTVPEGVKIIEERAFMGTGLNGTLSLPSSLEEIGEYAFYTMDKPGFIGNLLIPDSVKKIGRGAFYGNTFGGQLVLSNSLTTIESDTFLFCGFSGDLSLPKNIKSVESYAFGGGYYNGNREYFDGSSFIIPDSLDFIGSNAFIACGFNDVFTLNDNLLIGEAPYSLGTPGYTVIHCKRNSKSYCYAQKYGYEISDSLDITAKTCRHKYGEWEIIKEPRVDEEGIKARVCSVCGEKETESIPKLTNTDTTTDTPSDTLSDTNEPAADPVKQTGSDGTALGEGASAQAAEAAITGMKSDNDLPGSVFNKLQLKSSKQTNTSITLSWKKVSGAKTYVIYGNKSGKTNKMKRLAKSTGKTKKITKILGKKVKKGTYYKFMIVALDKNDNVVSSSKIIHVATKGGKVGNVGKITTKAKKNKVSIRKGKTFKLGAKQVAANKKLKVKIHKKLSYESSNQKVATVSKSGKITAKKKGTCKIYVFAQDGISKVIKVTVK